VSNCINRRKLVPERVDRGGTLRYAWLRAPPLRHAIKIKPKPQLGRLTQEAPYEGGQRRALRAVPTILPIVLLMVGTLRFAHPTALSLPGLTRQSITLARFV